MPKRLTDALVRNARPKQSRYEIRSDTGLRLRVEPTGTKSFCCVYWYRNHQRRHTFGRYPAISLAEAIAAHGELLQKLDRGLDPKADLQPGTVDELADDYARRHLEGLRSADQRAGLLNNHVLPHIGRLKVKQVTGRDIIHILDRIVDAGTPTMANRVLSTCRTLFDHGISRKYLESNPCAGIKPPHREKPRERVLTDEELVAVWNFPAGDGRLQSLLRMLVLTGCRVGEVASMAWPEIEAGAWTVPASRAKSQRAHLVPLPPLALEELERAKGWRRNDWVYPGTGSKCMSSTWPVMTLREHGAEHTVHDIRRTFATRISDLGVEPYVVAALLNHSARTVTARHYQVNDYRDQKAAALSRWDQALRKILRLPGGTAEVFPFPARK